MVSSSIKSSTSRVRIENRGQATAVAAYPGDAILLAGDPLLAGVQFDLTKHAGETIKIELENRSSD